MKMILLPFLAFLVVTAGAAEHKTAPAYRGPDDRYKADILLVIAHPDDETGDIAGYLARAIFDQHRRVAVVCATRGDGGDNAVGNARHAALGVEREIEARRALAFLGIQNVWFLGAPDTPSQDVLGSLEHWNHGSVLGEVVRLIRLTQPEVILTWLPNYVAGENHADHQAASIIATEAFDLAGDPTAFSEQISGPRSELDITAEGLDPWQPQKIYYYSDASDALGYWLRTPPKPSPFRKNFLDGAGPVYLATDVSPSRRTSYARISAEETSFYLTQDGSIGKKAVETNSFKDFEYPVHLIFGKSVVGGGVTHDVFAGVVGEVPFAGKRELQNQIIEDTALTLGGPWNFYRQFWKAHNIENIAELLPVAEMQTKAGAHLWVPLLLRNTAQSDQQLRLQSELPRGWSDRTSYDVYPVGGGGTYPVEAIINIPETETPGWFEVTWNVERGGQIAGTAKVRVYVAR